MPEGFDVRTQRYIVIDTRDQIAPVRRWQYLAGQRLKVHDAERILRVRESAGGGSQLCPGSTHQRTGGEEAQKFATRRAPVIHASHYIFSNGEPHLVHTCVPI